MEKPIIILGSGGHAKVLIDALVLNSAQVLGLTDVDQGKHGTEVKGITILGNDDIVLEYDKDAIFLVNGLGSVEDTSARAGLYRRFKSLGYSFASVIHPAAIIAADVQLAEGVQIMAGAVIQTGSRVGANALINTRASVDHECSVGEDVHIAPGVTLSGAVHIGMATHIGTGATVINNVNIGSKVVVGAGSLVLQDIPDGQKVFGVPAKSK